MTAAAVDLFKAHFWLVKLGFIVTTAIVAQLVFSLLFMRLIPYFQKKQKLWRYSLIVAAKAPLYWFIWFMALNWVLTVLVLQFNLNGSVIASLPTLRVVFSVVFLLWFGMRLIATLEKEITRSKHFGKRELNDTTTVNAMAQVARILMVLILALVAMQALGIPIGALLTFGGIGGLAVSFAAKDTLANFLGGMMVYWDRPFAVGDWIRSPDREIEGTVENIGWRLTRIRTPDKRLLYVPNGVFSTISVENPSRMSHRRIQQNMGVRYEDAGKLKAIIHDIEQMLNEHPQIATEQPPLVCFTEFARSSLNFLVTTFTKTTDGPQYQKIQQDVLFRIIDIVNQHGAEFAFPTQVVHVPGPLSIHEIKTLSDKN